MLFPTHSSIRSMANVLGSSEFCSILNRNDAALILKSMKRFLRTVRLQQQQSRNEDIIMDEESDEEEDLEPKPKKLKESWKEDTAAYNVPFVGTAVASAIDIVEVGKWPTGLLQGYISKSPLAIEFTDRFFPGQEFHAKLVQSQRQSLADAIAGSAWKILTRLILPENTRLHQHLLKTTLPVTLKCLPQKQLHDSIVPFLTALALESKPAARTIARQLNESTIRSLLRPKSEVVVLFLQLVVILQHDGIVGIAFPMAVQHHPSETIAPLLEYLEANMNRSWYFITKDVLRTLCRKRGTEKLQKALALNFRQSPLYARKSNEPLLLQLVAHHLLKDSDTVKTVLRHRPRMLESLYQELPQLPDHVSNPMGYIATLRTLTMLAKEFTDCCDLPKQFRRQQIIKAVNSPNPVVSYQTMVYLVAVLDHFRLHAAPEQKLLSLSQALPDVVAMLNCVSKFRANYKPHDLLRSFAGLMLSRQLELFPSTESLDLTTLLPTLSFNKLPTSLQDMMLKSVRRALDHTKVLIFYLVEESAFAHIILDLARPVVTYRALSTIDDYAYESSQS